MGAKPANAEAQLIGRMLVLRAQHVRSDDDHLADEHIVLRQRLEAISINRPQVDAVEERRGDFNARLIGLSLDVLLSRLPVLS
jgi:hypothetical protein